MKANFPFSTSSGNRSILNRCINKYTVAVIFFVVWLFFFDSNRLPVQWKLKNAVSSLEEEKKSYQSLIVQAKRDQKDLEINKEKFGREKYFMHRPDEEVYIVEDIPEKK